MRTAGLLAWVACTAVQGVAAQTPSGLRSGLRDVAASPTALRASAASVARRVAPNDWKEGAAIGLLVGTPIGIVLYGIERDAKEVNNPGIWYFFGPMAIGAFIGAMIGSEHHKT